MLSAGFGLVATLALAGAAVRFAGFDDHFLVAATLSYLAIVAIALSQLHHHPHRRFGAPNAITTFRAALTAQLIGAIVDVRQLASADMVLWQAVAAGLVLLTLALDGLDGRLARRGGLVSPFGARYDMEVDALMILAAAALAWLLGQAGAWILLIGAMRYLFVAAGLALPWLAGPLPPSLRRKTICAVQYAALVIVLAPVLGPTADLLVAAASLAALLYSFAVDTLWLHRHRRVAA